MELCAIEGMRAGVQFSRRPISSRSHMVGYMLRRAATSSQSASPVNEYWRGHLGGLGTMSETSRTPLASSAALFSLRSAETLAIRAASSAAPLATPSPSATCSLLTGSVMSAKRPRSPGSSALSEASEGTTASWPLRTGRVAAPCALLAPWYSKSVMTASPTVVVSSLRMLKAR